MGSMTIAETKYRVTRILPPDAVLENLMPGVTLPPASESNAFAKR
jgi:hypothetical protein